MRYAYKNLPSPEVGVKYPAVIVSASIQEEDTDKERVLINTRIEGYLQPSPASFATGNETGANMLTTFLNAMGYDGTGDFREFLKGKAVNVKLSNAKDGEHINASVYAPSQKVADDNGSDCTL